MCTPSGNHLLQHTVPCKALAGTSEPTGHVRSEHCSPQTTLSGWLGWEGLLRLQDKGAEERRGLRLQQRGVSLPLRAGGLHLTPHCPPCPEGVQVSASSTGPPTGWGSRFEGALGFRRWRRLPGTPQIKTWGVQTPRLTADSRQTSSRFHHSLPGDTSAQSPQGSPGPSITPCTHDNHLSTQGP